PRREVSVVITKYFLEDILITAQSSPMLLIISLLVVFIFDLIKLRRCFSFLIIFFHYINQFV
mgnify:CR=1